MSNGSPPRAVHHKGRTLNARILCLVFTMMVFGVLATLSLISLRATQAANFELGQKLLEAERNAATIMATLRDAQDSLERVSAEAAAATKGQQQAHQDLSTLNKENTGLKAELKEIQRGASACTTQLATCTNKLAEALQRANDSAAQLNSLKAQAAGSPQQHPKQQQQQRQAGGAAGAGASPAAKAGSAAQLEQALEEADHTAGSSGSGSGGGRAASGGAAERRGQREAGAEEEDWDADAADADARFPREGDLEDEEEAEGGEEADEEQADGEAAAGRRQGGSQWQGAAGGAHGAER